jgi:hypothetical protein
MNPTVKMVLHWTLNIVLGIATLSCIALGLFGLQGTDASSIFNRAACVVTGGVFGFLCYTYVKFTLKQG